jgi:hypothetical protein
MARRDDYYPERRKDAGRGIGAENPRHEAQGKKAGPVIGDDLENDEQVESQSKGKNLRSGFSKP